MGIYIGKERLIEKKKEILALSPYAVKGLDGEIQVGELLEKLLPNDTYIIAHPIIGKYEPDFLVISPRYGFRLIEVKNWSLNPISSAKTNGDLIIAGKKQNPVSQVKNFVDDLNGYLSSHFRHLPELYQSIGYAVIHYGFTSTDFKTKFGIERWDPSQSNSYFQFHLFRNQLTEGMDQRLKSATKYPGFPADRILSGEIVKDFVQDFRIAEIHVTDNDIEIYKTTKELELRTRNLEEKTAEILKAKEEMSTYYVSQQNSEKNKSQKPNKTILLVAVIALLLFSGYLAINFFKANDDHISEVLTEDSIGKNIEFEAKVESFHYDKESGVKLLTLSDDQTIIDAVILKDTKVPFVNEGDSYKFYGTVQKYKGRVQLRINSIE
jgi:hypothetical protein